MLPEEINEVHKSSVIYKENQGAIFLAKNRQVGMRTKHVDICRHILRCKVEDTSTDIKYIRKK